MSSVYQHIFILILTTIPNYYRHHHKLIIGIGIFFFYNKEFYSILYSKNYELK